MTSTITSSFSQRYLPWMKIGKVIDEESVNSARAAELGGIDFEVELRPAAYWRPKLDENGTDNGDGEWVEEPSRRAIVRVNPDDGEPHEPDDWFSFVSTDYRPVQYHEAFSFLDEINPNYVAAGALSHGRKGFMIVQLPEHMQSGIEINGEVDPHDLYVVVQTSHDLSRGVNVAIVMLRNKCMNMLTLPSFTLNAPQSWSIPHIGDPHTKLREAHRTLTNAGRYQEIFERQVRQYASVELSSDDVRQISRRILPKRLKTIDDQVEQIVQRFETAETVGFHGTGWGAINAVSDYLQWGRNTATRTNQSEFTSPLEGDTAKYVNRVAQLVMQRA